MRNVSVSEFVDRVLSTDMVVPFTAADPFGHMRTGRYLDVFIDHRFEAFDRQTGVNWYQIARELHAGYVLTETNLKLLRPLPAGGKMTVASWVTGHGKKNVSIRGVFVGPDRAAHAVLRVEMIAVDTRTGRAVENPEMPARDDAAGVDALPRAAEFLANVTGLPPE